MTQLTGKFPVFGKSAKIGTLTDAKGKVINNQFPSFYVSNRLAYENGFTEIDAHKLNGVLNFITEALSELYTSGIAPYTLNVAYPKGAVVRFNGELYVSKTDDNILHVSQHSHWDKIKLQEQGVCTKQTGSTDSNPIGTILTVPVTTTKEGYIDYVEGSTFNKTIYPELYKTLGSDRFDITTGNIGSDTLPIGSCIHLLSANTDVPNGYVEWKPFTSIHRYPELKAELVRVAERIADLSVKERWLQALRSDLLPDIDGHFLGIGQAGLISEDSVRLFSVTTPPVVIDHSNTLNPLGITRCVAEEQVYPVLASDNMTRTHSNTNFVVTGMSADKYPANTDKRAYQIQVGSGDVTKPKSLFTRILVKAINPRPSSISSTHKQIIKAF